MRIDPTGWVASALPLFVGYRTANNMDVSLSGLGLSNEVGRGRACTHCVQLVVVGVRRPAAFGQQHSRRAARGLRPSQISVAVDMPIYAGSHLPIFHQQNLWPCGHYPSGQPGRWVHAPHKHAPSHLLHTAACCLVLDRHAGRRVVLASWDSQHAWARRQPAVLDPRISPMPRCPFPACLQSARATWPLPPGCVALLLCCAGGLSATGGTLFSWCSSGCCCRRCRRCRHSLLLPPPPPPPLPLLHRQLLPPRLIRGRCASHAWPTQAQTPFRRQLSRSLAPSDGAHRWHAVHAAACATRPGCCRRRRCTGGRATQRLHPGILTLLSIYLAPPPQALTPTLYFPITHWHCSAAAALPIYGWLQRRFLFFRYCFCLRRLPAKHVPPRTPSLLHSLPGCFIPLQCCPRPDSAPAPGSEAGRPNPAVPSFWHPLMWPLCELLR